MLLSRANAPATPRGPQPPLGLHLTVDGTIVPPALVAPGWYGFRIVPPAGPVRLRAPTFCPAEIGSSDDSRRLGFAINGLQIITDNGSREISVTLGALREGFHAAEAGGWRWTDGDAVLPDILFHGIHGPALLVVRGFGQDGPGHEASHHAAFLAGDSWPADEHVEQHLFRVLHPFLADGKVTQNAMLAPDHRGHPERDLAARVARLELAVAGWRGRGVLFGRSSGARVATLFARRHDVAAVVCLGYPFHAPGRAAEPERVAHLANMATPTLIIQGRDDPYGDAEAARACRVSSRVALHLIDGDHEFHLGEAQWAAVARRILLFLAECA